MELDGIFEMLGRTTRNYDKAIERMELQKRMAFAQWLTAMAYQHGKPADQILKRFNESIRAIEDELKKGKKKG